MMAMAIVKLCTVLMFIRHGFLDDTDDDDSNGMSASRFDSSLNVITKKFFELFKNAPDGVRWTLNAIILSFLRW